MDYILPDYDDLPTPVKKEPLNDGIVSAMVSSEENGNCDTMVNDLPVVSLVEHFAIHVKKEPLDEEVISADENRFPMQEEDCLNDIKPRLLSWEDGNCFSINQSNENYGRALTPNNKRHSQEDFQIVEDLDLNQPCVNISKDNKISCKICAQVFTATVICLEHCSDQSAKESKFESNNFQHTCESEKTSEAECETCKRRYICDGCGVGLDRDQHFEHKYSSVVKPIRKQTKVKSHTCTVCGVAFSHSANLLKYLLKHVLKHTVTRTETLPLKSHTCTVCGVAFSQSVYLLKHSLKHTVTQTETQPLDCKFCGKIYKTEKDLIRHSKNGSNSKCCPLSDHQIIQDGRLHYYCKNCESIFSNKEMFKRHSCQSYNTSLEKASQNHKELKQPACHVCNKSFNNSYSLSSHMLIHDSKARQHACHVCGKAFTKPRHLEIHKHTHSKEKPHTCSDCGKAFRLPYCLKKQKLTHIKTKSYYCAVCGKEFSKLHYLRKHILIHTIEKPSFMCEDCGIGFSKKRGLERHAIRIHPVSKNDSKSVIARKKSTGWGKLHNGT